MENSKLDLRKNIKILFFSDSHLGYDFVFRKAGKNHRGEDFFKNFEFIVDKAISLGVDLLIHGGDLFHKSNVNQKIIDRAYDSFIKAADNNIPIVIIPGNHDGGILPESLFSQHPLFNIVNETSILNFNLNGKKIRINAIPFKRKIREVFNLNLPSLINIEDEETFEILLVHQSIEGAKVGPKDYTFRTGSEVIAMEQIPDDYNLVLSGHIHRFQILKKNELPIIYCGSTEKTSFAEFGEDKGFVLIEFPKQDNYLNYRINFEKIPSRKMNKMEVKGEFNSSFELEEYLQNKVDKQELSGMLQIECSNENTIGMLNKDLINKVFGKELIVNVKGKNKEYFLKNYKLKL